MTSISALLGALANDTVTEIVVADGTYHVSPAAAQASDSLWIGSRFASRTKPVLVRAETTGGVMFDGGGAYSFGGIAFNGGAHDQTWQGFVWQNGTSWNGSGDGTGVLMFGGYAGQAPPHHITLRDIKLRQMTNTTVHGCGIYVSWAAYPGPHDILFDGVTIEDPGKIMRYGLQFYHSDASNPNAWNVTLRNFNVVGTQSAVTLWDPTLRNIVMEDSSVTGALDYAVRYEKGGTFILRRVSTSGSGAAGFYSTIGVNPPDVTFIDSSLH